MTDAPRSENQARTLPTPLAAALAVAAGLARLIPHPFNMTPVGALGLFGGARLRLGYALTLPLAVMAVTDLFLWAALDYRPFNPWVYGCFAFNVLLGRCLTRTRSPWLVGGAAGIGAVVFFLVTNFGVWLGSSVDPATLSVGAAFVTDAQNSPYPFALVKYARNPAGLAACYTLGAFHSRDVSPPFGFFGNGLAGDLFFTGLLFGTHALLAGRLAGRRVRSSKPLPASQ